MNMRSLRRPAIIAATSVAVIGLAFGGTAAADAFITGKDIKNGSVAGKDIKNNSIKGKDITNGSVHRKELSDDAVKAIRAGLVTPQVLAGILGGHVTDADLASLLAGKVSPDALEQKLAAYLTADEVDALLTEFATVTGEAYDGFNAADEAAGDRLAAIEAALPDLLDDEDVRALIADFLTEAQVDAKLDDYLKSDDFDAQFGNGNWGVNLRNTQGTASAMLRSGPFATNFGRDLKPAMGSGSLQLLTSGTASKVDFGNEVDFNGLELVDTLGDTLAYSVHTTKENQSRGNATPVIRIEVDPNLVNGEDYGTLVFVPSQPLTAGAWTRIDAMDSAQGGWFLTDSSDPRDGQGTDCTMATLCTFEQVTEKLSDATIHSISIGTNGTGGPDFQGAVDKLELADTVYDFEARGVFESDAVDPR